MIKLNNINKIYTDIQQVRKRKYEGYVYNLYVENDHSFMVNGCATLHNCQSLAAGTPVIITDYSELSNFKKGTLKIKPVAFYVEPRSNIRRAIPGVDDLTKEYTSLYDNFLDGKIKSIEEEHHFFKDLILKYDLANGTKSD